MALSQDMYTDGYKNIVNIDYSGVCIEKMQSKHPHMTCERETSTREAQKGSFTISGIEGDVRHLPLESASFDVAIDKGTMDAFMTAKGDVWAGHAKIVKLCSVLTLTTLQDPPQEIVQSCNQEVDEAIRYFHGVSAARGPD
ncbi:hypothetical protein EMMF5_005331 [Cystobasidiomycetes sp. EMM_F5]